MSVDNQTGQHPSLSLSERDSLFQSPSFTMTLVILIVAAIAVAVGGVPNAAAFKLETPDAVVEALMGLFVAALLMERIQEVFITAWRSKETEDLKTNLDALKTDYQRNSTDTISSQVLQATRALNTYKKKTRDIAFGLGLFLGFTFALVGVRSLSAMTEYENLVGFQAVLFNVFDLFLTAGVIAGGSDAIHKLISVFTDGFDTTRIMLKKKAAAEG